VDRDLFRRGVTTLVEMEDQKGDVSMVRLQPKLLRHGQGSRILFTIDDSFPKMRQFVEWYENISF